MTGQVTYRPYTDELRDRLRAIGSPQSAVESTLIMEVQANLDLSDQARKRVRQNLEQNPLALCRYHYEDIAAHDGMAYGVLFALEILRGVRAL